MKRITKLWPGGKTKAFTLSYDDGVEQDRRLLEIFNTYNLKATFNLNSGIQHEGSFWVDKGITIRRMNPEGLKGLYEGHEIAVHSLTHPVLPELPRENVLTELLDDKRNLERQFGYLVTGMAYPYGAYNAATIEVLKACGLEYARTVNSHLKFNLPYNPYEWHPTCHHNHPELMNLTESFLADASGSLSLFYVWGHSYEFDVQDNWELIEAFSQSISNHPEVWYATNIEIIRYIEAHGKLKFSADCTMVYNPCALAIWISVDGQAVEVPPGKTLQFL
ncbi:polysaccharide deacetylase [Paenibacillus sp. FSL R7-0273]|uniref:polysaccharide deacetylase family protein n=1 Tax=Paenibacillus sp. FSL R7-0273 TaxID=1536772 RepID=UPI0004F63889|nr:polysaccharide deacetylase family protein [Paenibacillus sp. FSL R7-0273]AIQ46534.1 polysaccharide deacetylase [Paenibacillus sp. FSL R7-0273]OMF97698.1 polysaccharide deacetylase [Paenibacillus sp. FSL R7-0273]